MSWWRRPPQPPVLPPLRVLFNTRGDFEAQLLTWLEHYDAVLGCVCLLRSQTVLAALNARPLSIVLLEQEPHLRAPRSRKPANDLTLTVQALYENLASWQPGGYLSTLLSPEEQAQGSQLGWHAVIGIPDVTQEQPYVMSMARYRVVAHHSGLGGHAWMHHKFLVGAQLAGEFLGHGPRWLVPQSVWCGSWNMTQGHRNNDDHALIIDDTTVARQFYEEWARLMPLSYPWGYQLQPWRIEDPVDRSRLGATNGVPHKW